jgi:Fe-S-cluster-containing dehydrogenase component
MTKWAMVIDLDKCVACQGCSIACRFENNTPVVAPDQAEMVGPFAGTMCFQIQ